MSLVALQARRDVAGRLLGGPARRGQGGGTPPLHSCTCSVSGLGWGHARSPGPPGFPLRPGRRDPARPARRDAAYRARRRRLGRPPARLARRCRRALRTAGRRRALAGRAAADVRAGGGGAPAARLLRRGPAPAPPLAHRRPRGAHPSLRRRARRALHHRRPVSVPRRPRQRRLARGPDRPVPGRGHDGGHRLGRRPARSRVPAPGWRAHPAAAAPGTRRPRRHGGSCQRSMEHAVPKSTRAVGPRISIQFRPHGVR